MENEQLEERKAIAGLKADRIRQLLETEGWKQVEEWIKQELSIFEKQAMNPGFLDYNSYIIAKGKYQGLESILLYIKKTLEGVKRLNN